MTTHDFLPVGSPAADFEVMAIGSKRPFRLSQMAATPVLLSFVDYRTQLVVRQLNRTLRTYFPEHTDVLAATVVEAGMIPRLMRGFASGVMEGAYREAAREVPADRDPADYLILLPDWDNAISQQYRIPADGFAAVVLVDRNGRVAGSYSGSDVVKVAMGWLAPDGPPIP